MNFKFNSWCVFNSKRVKLIIGTFLLLLTSCSIAQVASKAEDISPLLIGEKIPDATVLDVEGQPVRFSDLIKKRKTILIFYRGGWCPYCNAHLSDVGKIEKELDALGYQVVAISPDDPKQLSPMQEKNDFKYILLSDQKGDLIRATGIAFKAPASSEKHLITNQPDRDNLILPVPSLFIVDKHGEILFEFINPNYKHRINGYLLLSAAKAIALEKYP